MIAQREHIGLVALHVCQFVAWVLGKGVFAVSHSVRLYVGFCRHVDAILVAEVIPSRVVGIVTSADGVDIELLHYLYVLYHAFYAHHIASVGVELMTVGTLDEYWLSVDEQLSALYLHLAESHFLRYCLYGVAALFQRYVECI